MFPVREAGADCGRHRREAAETIARLTQIKVARAADVEDALDETEEGRP
jgi:hypothetical protein